MEGTGVAVTEGVGVGVAGVEGAGVEGVGVGVEADGVGAGLFDTLRIAMSMFAPTARAFAGSFGSTVRAAASKPRIVWPGTISYPSGNAGSAVSAARDGLCWSLLERCVASTVPLASTRRTDPRGE